VAVLARQRDMDPDSAALHIRIATRRTEAERRSG
jgi:hypothetical protein